jgi:hypothetical protein
MLKERPSVIGYRVPDSRRVTAAGWPDWVFIGRRILWREVKGDYDTLSPAQRRLARYIVTTGGDWRVWEPRDLRGGLIEQELDSISLENSR